MTFREWHQQKTSEGYVINFDDAEWGWDARDAEVEAMKERMQQLENLIDAMMAGQEMSSFFREAQQYRPEEEFIDSAVEALRAECSALAAGACCLPNDGLSADEGGVIFCEQERKVKALRLAVEHAEYMAKFADLFLAADNELQTAIAAHECTDSEETETAVDMASESKSEAWRSLTSSIYEFRKRAAKALGE